MKRVRYCVAASLDGDIAGPAGEVDWVIMDPEIDFATLMAGFDTVLMGRRTYLSARNSESSAMPGMHTYVASTTLQQVDHPQVTILGRNLQRTVAGLRQKSGGDIWLFGGSELFRRLLIAGLVDTVEVAVIPVLLGAGRPLLPASYGNFRLRLLETRVYSKTGIVRLDYAVEAASEISTASA